MKKVLLMATFAVASITGFSQTSKGTWLLGGGAGFSSSKTGDAKASTVSFSPNAGYFVMDNFAAGLSLSVTSGKTNSGAAGEADSKESISSFGPFVRYYFPLAGTTKIFANAGVGFGSTKYDDLATMSSTTWALSAGPAFFLNKNTALEVAISYGSTKVKDFTESTNTFGINVGFQIHLGK